MSAALSHNRAPERRRTSSFAGGLERLDAAECGQYRLARLGAVAQVLDDLEISVAARRLDAKGTETPRFAAQAEPGLGRSGEGKP
jgi:hypothetical protein